MPRRKQEVLGEQLEEVYEPDVEIIDSSMYDNLDAQIGYVDLKNKIEKILVRGQKTGFRDNNHISDLKSDCNRFRVLSHFYKSNIVFHGAKQAAIWQQGNDFHKRWQDAFLRAGVALDIERTHIETYWDVQFHPDAIIDLDGEPTIVELKGYNEREYIREITGEKAPMDAIVQCNIYMWMTGIHRGIVIVENKNTQDFTCWPLHYNSELTKLQEAALNLDKQLCDIHVQSGALPKKLAICENYEDERPCSCRYRDVCFMSQLERDGMRLDG